jgi:hypothetical protein
MLRCEHTSLFFTSTGTAVYQNRPAIRKSLGRCRDRNIYEHSMGAFYRLQHSTYRYLLRAYVGYTRTSGMLFHVNNNCNFIGSDLCLVWVQRLYLHVCVYVHT